ncbi:MAG: nitroreductase family protein [Lachnospirales bacterium]
MNYYQLATKRKSTRDFKEKNVSADILNEIKSYFGNCKKLIPEINIDIDIIDPESAPNLTGCAGYQDYLIKAPNYVLITSEDADGYMLNAGFVGEDIVLKLTDLGLASCWVTINDTEKFKKRFNLEKVPVVLIAFGYENSVSSTKRLDIFNISNVTLKKRSNYEAPKLYVDDAIYYEDMGIKADNSTLDHYTDLYQALVSACCAPSFLNRQPYRFVINKGNFILAALEDEMTDANDYELNLGIVMLNFYGALSERSGAYGKWEVGVSEDKLAGCDMPENSKAVAVIKI